MLYFRLVVGLAALTLLVAVVGCSSDRATALNSATSSPQSTSTPAIEVIPAGPTAQAMTPTAQVQSITPAKPPAVLPGGGPRLALDAEMVDFGNVPFGTVVAYSFSLKNVGSAPLSLDAPYIRVKEGC